MVTTLGTFVYLTCILWPGPDSQVTSVHQSAQSVPGTVFVFAPQVYTLGAHCQPYYQALVPNYRHQ